MELPGTGAVLTSDSFFYFAGQLLLWAVLAGGAAALLRRPLRRGQRIALLVALGFAIASSLSPLFIRWALSMPWA